MARNRTELKEDVNTSLQSSNLITAATHRALLNEKVIESVVLREDLKISYNAGSNPSYTADFDAADYIIISNIVEDFEINFSGLVDGDIKYLEVQRTGTGNTISFPSVQKSSGIIAALNDDITKLRNIKLRVIVKNGVTILDILSDNDSGLAGNLAKRIAYPLSLMTFANTSLTGSLRAGFVSDGDFIVQGVFSWDGASSLETIVANLSNLLDDSFFFRFPAFGADIDTIGLKIQNKALTLDAGILTVGRSYYVNFRYNIRGV